MQLDHQTTISLSSRQLRLITALVCHQEQLLQAKGKESGRTLLFEHVEALTAEHDQAALTTSLQTALTRLQTAITLEYYRVTFVALNYTDAGLERFKESLKETFPQCERYVCTLQQSDQEEDPDVLGFHVYVPVDAGPPSVPLLLELVSDLKGVQFDNLSQCWQGQKDTAIDDSWTLLT